MTPHRLLTLLSFVLLATGAGCGEPSSTGPAASADLPLVAVEPVVALDFTERILATGELIARNHADVAAEVDGRVTQLWMEEGAAVAEGAAVLEIDPVRRQLELEAAKARVNEYMKNGGTILFDTQNAAGGADISALRRLARGLDTPPLVPVSPDHVLTRSFYLIQEFPGRWTGGTLWQYKKYFRGVANCQRNKNNFEGCCQLPKFSA